MTKLEQWKHCGNVLRAVLKRQAVSQSELATRLGMTKQQVSQLIRRKGWNLRTMAQVCGALGVELTEFMASPRARAGQRTTHTGGEHGTHTSTVRGAVERPRRVRRRGGSGPEQVEK